MSGGKQNIPIIRLEQRVEDLKKGFKVNSTSSLISLGTGASVLNITSSGLIGVNVASPNTQSIITVKNNDQIGWQNASAFLTRTPSSTSVTTRDAGSRIFKSSDNNFYVDNMDGNIIFRRGGVVSGANFLFSNTIFISGTTGNVGLSNSAPEARLHVGSGGDILLENNRQIFFKNSSGVSRSVLKVGSSGLTSITSPVSLSLNVGSDSAEVQGMLISSDGRVNVISDLYTSGMYRIIDAPTVSSTAGSTTLTAAQVLARIFTSTATAAVTLGFPTGTLIDGVLPSNSPIGTSFEFTIVNAGTVNGAISFAPAPAGLTFYIATTASVIAINASRTYLFRKTGTNTFDVFTTSMS